MKKVDFVFERSLKLILFIIIGFQMRKAFELNCRKDLFNILDFAIKGKEKSA